MLLNMTDLVRIRFRIQICRLPRLLIQCWCFPNISVTCHLMILLYLPTLCICYSPILILYVYLKIKLVLRNTTYDIIHLMDALAALHVFWDESKNIDQHTMWNHLMSKDCILGHSALHHPLAAIFSVWESLNNPSESKLSIPVHCFLLLDE